ncbi:MAG TPA: cyclic-di-AMP receptor, partial [Aggregatilineaceae bacterium]|nr:cyclic-di-AMP receptor [Aggregatilineaceae bacterium]
AIVSAEAVDTISRALTEKRYPVTHISSQGGFLRRGSTTMVIGVEEVQVRAVLEVIRAACGTPSNPDTHTVTLFVVEASQFIQF